MISLISLTLFLLLSLLFSLFYFVFTAFNFANLNFCIINISVPLSKIMEEMPTPYCIRLLQIFCDLSPSSNWDITKKSSLDKNGGGHYTKLTKVFGLPLLWTFLTVFGPFCTIIRK